MKSYKMFEHPAGAYKDWSHEAWDLDTIDVDFDAMEANEARRNENRAKSAAPFFPTASPDGAGAWG